MKRLPVLLAFSLAAAGCGAQPQLLGTEGKYLLTARDVLALPGEEVSLVARLQGGDFLQDQPGYVMRFERLEDRSAVRAAQTDEEGKAVVTWTPDVPGDTEFEVGPAPAGFEDAPPEPQTLLVACRAADEPIAVVDLDKTLVASGFQAVLLGDPKPMPHSTRVVEQLSREHTIVYLTHRPEYFGPKSKAWLRRQGYPRGPVLLSTATGFLKGSGAYKTQALAELGERFTHLRVGIGDKPSDAMAYHDNGMTSILVFHMPAGEDPEPLAKLAEEIGDLAETVHVVTDWQEVGKVLFEGASFPPERIRKRLADKVVELEARAAAGDGEEPGEQP